MPNWVKNKIIVGKSEFIDEIRQKHASTGSDEEKDCFDFNTVVKMPDDMNLEFGSRSDDGLSLFITKKSPKCPYFGSKEDKVAEKEVIRIKKLMENHLFVSNTLELDEEKVKSLQEKYKDKIDEVVSLGERMVNNVEKHGAMNWYEWSVKNWGTKWNSANTEWDKKSFTFETAWDPAIPVVIELSKQHPDMKLAFLYSDEEIGSHVGYMLLQNGRVDYQGTFPDQGRDAYKLAFDLWGCGDEFKYNEKKGTYERKPWEEENKKPQPEVA